MRKWVESLDYLDSELVLALVYAAGTDAQGVQEHLVRMLPQFGYVPQPLRLSEDILEKKLRLDVEMPDAPAFARIWGRMDAGNKAREEAQRADFLALAAVSQITHNRPIADGRPEPQRRACHIIRSLKRPEEVVALRQVYGPGFFLIGVFASESTRQGFLETTLGMSPEEAIRLMNRDEEEKEEEKWGQRTRDTFHLADVFISLDAEWETDLGRFLDLIFETPVSTPVEDENAMFLAYAASCRSASFSRQVGAAVFSDQGELLSVGCNDVPCYEGGLYWPGSHDHRDHKFRYKGNTGVDTNDACKQEIVSDIMARLRTDIPEESRLNEGMRILGDSQLMDITEYGRAVHAEMEALLACARSGTSPRYGTLYSTTFPCHNCTRHIVAAGIKRVVYVEPYPKSRALELHSDAIALGADDPDQRKVRFEPFVGVGPRRYLDLFSMEISTGRPLERKRDGQVRDWTRADGRLRVPMLPNSYLRREQIAFREIRQTLQRLEVENGNA
jgi:deoxycytidylate deaminase